MINNDMINKNNRTVEIIIDELKDMIKDRLMLDIEIDEIDENALLFEPENFEDNDEMKCLGLDSVDGLEIMVGIQSMYKVKIDANENKRAYRSISTLALAVVDALKDKEE